jgi:hypothetical protein
MMQLVDFVGWFIFLGHSSCVPPGITKRKGPTTHMAPLGLGLQPLA